MAKELMKTKPTKVSTIPVVMPTGIEGTALDLNDIVVQVIWDMKEAEGWSWRQTANELGIEVQTLYDMLLVDPENPDAGPSEGKKGRRKGITLFTLSKIVAAKAHGNPILFFRRHPLFGRTLRPVRRDAAGDVYGALCARLTKPQAERLTHIIDVLVGRQGLDDFLTSFGQVLGAKIPRQRRSRSRTKKSVSS